MCTATRAQAAAPVVCAPVPACRRSGPARLRKNSANFSQEGQGSMWRTGEIYPGCHGTGSSHRGGTMRHLTLAFPGRHLMGRRAFAAAFAVLMITAFGVIHGTPAALADPGDIYLNGCTDPANQAWFGSYATINLRNGPSTGYAS